MKPGKNWTDKMLMAALVMGVAGAAARAATAKTTAGGKTATKERKRSVRFKGVHDRRLALLMMTFEREIKAELKSKAVPKKSGLGVKSPLPRVDTPRR